MDLDDAVLDESFAADLEECAWRAYEPLRMSLISRAQWTRKSCEGLSVLLFLFAFMGNVTYVASILIK